MAPDEVPLATAHSLAVSAVIPVARELLHTIVSAVIPVARELLHTIVSAVIPVARELIHTIVSAVIPVARELIHTIVCEYVCCSPYNGRSSLNIHFNLKVKVF